MKPIIALFSILMFAHSAMAEFIIIRPTDKQSDPFKDKITGIAVARREAGSELVFVPIRGCGKITLFRNSKGELPKDGDRIEFAFDGRCKISDWKKI